MRVTLLEVPIYLVIRLRVEHGIWNLITTFGTTTN